MDTLAQTSSRTTFIYYPPGKATQPLLNAMGAFRRDVWRSRELNMAHCDDSDIWLEAADYTSHLWQVRAQDELVATARLSVCRDLEHLPERDLYLGLEQKLAPPYATMGRLAVAPAWRNRGIARQLIRARLKTADALGVNSILLDCPEHRVAGMERFGFRALKPPQQGVLCPELKFVVMARFKSESL